MSKRAPRKLTVPFGMKDGRPVFVSDVALGLDCGCICPECGEALVARNRDFPGRRRVRHFQHARTSSCPGGFESAVHRMAKEVLATADALSLPRWASGDIVIEPESLAIVNARAEVPLLDGAIRPDVLVHGMASDIEFDVLCVEIRVHHEIDDPKRDLLATSGVDTIEIDLSGLNDEAVADPVAFRCEVLENLANRCWVNLSRASYVAKRADKALIEIEDLAVSERVIITKKGRPFTIREQWGFLVKPGSRERVRIQIPDETVGEDAQPYPRGMHTISSRSITVDQWGRLRLRYKMYLDQIQMNSLHPDDIQRGLFDGADVSRGPGFNVRVRDWKGYPGY
ncbi:hypothetical protein EIQ10_20510 [Xanthomonas campestris pv. campestris]